MKRCAIVSLPDAIELGWTPSLFFFDHIVVPDLRYVSSALAECEEPKRLSSSHDPQGTKTVAEIRLGLGYHLWPGGGLTADWHRARSVLAEAELLRSKGLASAPTAGRQWSLRGSLGDFDSMLDEVRLRAALQVAHQDYVDVCTVRARPDHIALTSAPLTLDQAYAIRFLVKQLPMPLNTVPLAEIIAFRDDPEVQVQLANLRRWMYRGISSKLSLPAFEDEYAVLRDDYSKSVKRLGTRFRTSTLGMIAAVVTNVLDNVAQLKVGSAVKALFDWQHDVLRLDEELSKAPGREVAYMRALENRFGGAV